MKGCLYSVERVSHAGEKTLVIAMFCYEEDAEQFAECEKQGCMSHVEVNVRKVRVK